MKVTVVVLGDIGHSPRTLNQALSFSKVRNSEVNIISYLESDLPHQLQATTNLKLHKLKPIKLKPNLPKLTYLLFAPFKALFLALTLVYSLLKVGRSDYYLIQNPPAIPTLFIMQLFCYFTRARLIIDWHNFGFTILSLKFGLKHPIVKLAYYYEKIFGNWAYMHIAVTEAMALELKKVWKVKGKIVVLHDRASDLFQPIELDERHDVLIQLNEYLPQLESLTRQLYKDYEADGNHHSILTVKDKLGKITERKNRPQLLVSSSSWTPDEDFSILLEALQSYEQRRHEAIKSKKVDPDTSPRLVVIITGKGPDQAKYLSQIEALDFQYVTVLTAWLPFPLYAKLLASADLGLSLHQSSSNLDLPMKVVDMFASNLPVLALDFTCLNELVVDNHNGMVFSNAYELAYQLELVTVQSLDTLKKLKSNVAEFGKVKWDDLWNEKVLSELKH